MAPAVPHVVPGEVVAVTGTPNLWITDSQGMIHFASDPHALADRSVDWSNQADLSDDLVAALPHGDPWLSTALVKIGDSIYLPQWDANASTPTLRHIQSTDDLAQLGINASNYGQFVLDPSTWQQRYNVSLDRVEFDGDFNLTPPAPDPSSDASSSDTSSGSDTSTSSTPADIAA
jgi:hypothetical protein